MEGRHKQPQLSLWLLWLDVPIKQVSLDVFHSRDFDFGEACLNGGIKPKIGARELVLLSVSFLRAYVKFSTRLTLLGAGFKKHTLGKWSHLMQTPQESWLLGHQWLVENLTKWHWYCHKNRRPVEAQLANSPHALKEIGLESLHTNPMRNTLILQRTEKTSKWTQTGFVVGTKTLLWSGLCLGSIIKRGVVLIILV